MAAVHWAEQLSYEGQGSDAAVKRLLQGLWAPRLCVRRGLGHEIRLSARGRCGRRGRRVFTALCSAGITGNSGDNAVDLLFTVMHVLRCRERWPTLFKLSGRLESAMVPKLSLTHERAMNKNSLKCQFNWKCQRKWTYTFFSHPKIQFL